jgi:hypothetical protein
MSRFLENKWFAFSIYDDIDLRTIENTGPGYQLVTELGMSRYQR